MLFLTDFADQAVVLPTAAAVAAVLAARGWWRGAAVWVGVIGATFATVLAAKLGFLSCAPVFAPWDLKSPSGHTAAAAMVGGALAVLLSGRRAAALPAAILCAVVIGTSRVVLGFHTLPEVMVGGLMGMAGAMAFARLSGPWPARRPVLLLTIPALVALSLHGTHLGAEPVIWRASNGLLDILPQCQTRPGPL